MALVVTCEVEHQQGRMDSWYFQRYHSQMFQEWHLHDFKSNLCSACPYCGALQREHWIPVACRQQLCGWRGLVRACTCPSGSWLTTHTPCLPYSRKGFWLNRAPVLQSGSREAMSSVALDYDVHCQAEVNTKSIQILYTCLLVNACSLWDAC